MQPSSSSKQSMLNAFILLLEKKSYADITITDICREASVSNKTFYNYFENKQALVKAIIYADFAEPVLQIRSILPVDNIAGATKFMADSNHQRLYDHKEIYQNLLRSYGSHELKDDITEIVYNLNLGILGNYGFAQEETEFASYFLAAAGADLHIWWLTKRPDLSVEKFTDFFIDWCFARFREIGR